MNNTHDIIDDRIDVVTRGLMGLTVTCARCHDHKFDPIPSADYYSLYGVFRSSVEPTVPPLADSPPWEPEHLLYDAELKIREKKLVDFVTAKHTALVNGARIRAAEYLLAAHAARNQPPADDFMLLADPGDLNPSMITRWRQFLADSKKRKHPAFLHWHALAELPDAAFADKASAVLTGITGANKLVAAAFAEPPKSMKEVASEVRQAVRGCRQAVEGRNREGCPQTRRPRRGGAPPRALRSRFAGGCAAGTRLGLPFALPRSRHPGTVSETPARTRKLAGERSAAGDGPP